MIDRRFPHLTKLMDAWFNQDYDVGGGDEVDLLDDYARSSWADDVAETVAEIDLLLAMPTDGLLDFFISETGYGNMLIADDDEGARNWLLAARDRLVTASPPTRPPRSG